MSEPSTIWDEIWKAAAASAVLAAAGWGAAGGLTSALSISGLRRVDILRHIALGALTASGLGSAAGVVLQKWMDLPVEMIPAAGVGGGSSYLVGVFGPALFEVVLSQIRHRRVAPGEDG